jgi:Glucodextranase, domain B/PASTA domain
MRLWIAVFVTATAALGLLPAAAQATVSQSQITSWVTQSTDPQGHTTQITNGAYLLSLDNPPTPTTIDVKGSSQGGGLVDIVCFFGSGGSATLKSNLAVAGDGDFDTGMVPLQPIAGHACRLRAVPAGLETTSDNDPSFAGPQVAVSEAALPLSTISSATSPNFNQPYNYYVNDVTFTGWSAWKAVGTNGCGPYAAPIDPTFNVGDFAIDCAGSLLSDDLSAWGGRSEVQIDNQNAYDAASAQALVPRTNGQDNGTQDLPGFPTLSAAVNWDPSTGLISSSSHESFVACSPTDQYKPLVISQCQSFVDTGVELERDISTSDGGRVVRLTDTWSSTDGRSHTVDLLYDDYVGLSANPALRGYNFPGERTFSSHLAGDQVAAPPAGPGSIFVHTDMSASDGNPAAAFGAITYSTAPSGFHFAPAPPAATDPLPPSNEFEEHVVASVPAGGSASLSYVYSVGYSLADVKSLAMAAQDSFQAPAVAITSPGGSTTVSTPTVTLAGTAAAGSGIASLLLEDQGNPVGSVPVAPDGAWSTQVPLSPGSNTITALATDGAGTTVQAQVTVVYQPPSTPQPAIVTPSPTDICKVPKIKGMKLAVAKKALRHAHCRIGKIKHVKSGKVALGRVIRISSRPGRRLPAGAKVELFVSKGR